MRATEKLCYQIIIGVDVCFSAALRILGPILVLMANVLIGVCVYAYLWVLVPHYLIPELGMCATATIVVFGLWILFNILFNYWCCVLTPPGFPGDSLPAPDDLEEGIDFSDFGDGWRKCKKCKCGKPPRTHHCSVCKKCVMKMDHHCPWVNNCVGFRNYKFFCLFLVYTAVGCAYVALTCILTWVIGRGHSDTRRDNVLVFVFILVLAVLFALTLFLGWHSYLVASNQTTIEFYSNRMDAFDARKRGERWVNRWSVGVRGNFEQVFGMSRNVFSWLLPSRKPPPGDGMNFPLNPEGEWHEPEMMAIPV